MTIEKKPLYMEQLFSILRFIHKDKAYRDLIHQGYTVIYKVEEEKILILEIFKWQQR